MPIHLPGNRKWRASTRLLQLLALLGFAAALATLVLPGPANEATGVASVLALGSLALLAGHQWGAVVVSVADLALVGKLWPAVFLNADAPELFATIAFALAIPGLILFAVTLPTTAETILGKTSPRTQELAQVTLGVGSTVYMLLPFVAL